MRYLIVAEETSTGFSSYSPDFDGCVATGKTKEEVEKVMQEAMEFHPLKIRETEPKRSDDF
ncbi:HicB family protein [Methylococcaceae bacterium CS1]|nr:type II toxin-antitoxin system HicB family antitoxin [Methyloprofundus sp.]TXL03517.1 HicB family protein [Methylococcaceae bacterium CS1]TXL09591.1 HicB family protein [Methylococcaceae bacterium CS3]TXL12089.1 HicB family protein [Methylococcaceae bacterium CS2]